MGEKKTKEKRRRNEEGTESFADGNVGIGVNEDNELFERPFKSSSLEWFGFSCLLITLTYRFPSDIAPPLPLPDHENSPRFSRR